jgi:hypothetical protein
MPNENQDSSGVKNKVLIQALFCNSYITQHNINQVETIANSVVIFNYTCRFIHGNTSLPLTLQMSLKLSCHPKKFVGDGILALEMTKQTTNYNFSNRCQELYH